MNLFQKYSYWNKPYAYVSEKNLSSHQFLLRLQNVYSLGIFYLHVFLFLYHLVHINLKMKLRYFQEAVNLLYASLCIKKFNSIKFWTHISLSPLHPRPISTALYAIHSSDRVKRDFNNKIRFILSINLTNLAEIWRKTELKRR